MVSKDRDIAAVNVIVICRENWVGIKIKSAKLFFAISFRNYI